MATHHNASMIHNITMQWSQVLSKRLLRLNYMYKLRLQKCGKEQKCRQNFYSINNLYVNLINWKECEAIFTYLSSFVWQFRAAASLLRMSSTFPYGSPLPSDVLTDTIPTEPGLIQSGIDLPFVPSQYRMPFSSKSCMWVKVILLPPLRRRTKW